MKTKISVEIHKSGENNHLIVDHIAANNEGQVNVNYEYLLTALAMQRVKYSTINKELCMLPTGINEYSISEDNGKTFTLTLTWKEIHELAETEEQANVQLQKHLS